jgi:hydroxypyruvate reductase
MTQAATHTIPVLIVGALQPGLQAKVETAFDATRFWTLDDPAAWLREHGAEVRALMTSGVYGASAELLGQLPNLEAVFSFGVGYDSIAVDVLRERGIALSNTPEVLDDCVADTAMALVLDTLRGFSHADRFVRAGRWAEGRFPLARKVGGKTLGIVGLGNIGQAIARRASAFDMRVCYHNRSPKADVGYTYFADLDGLIEACDVLLLAVPGGAASIRWSVAARLRKLGPEGVLVNISRGTVVDQDALVEALQQHWIGGAGLDVFADEPNVPEALLAMDNVVLLPHLGSGTHETRQAMADLVWANVQGWFENDRTLVTPVR